MAEADAAWPAPRLRRLSSSDAVDLLEHLQSTSRRRLVPSPTYPQRQGGLHKAWDAADFDGNPSSTSPRTHKRATCLSYLPIVSFPSQYRGAVYCTAWRHRLSRAQQLSGRALCPFAALCSLRSIGPGRATSNAYSTTRSPPTCAAAGSRPV
jgi:hypothetical protein